MCIIILNQKNTLTKKVLNQSWESNSHGAGLMYVSEGNLEIFKTFDKSEFTKKYFEVRKLTKGPVILHFRIATSGQHNEENLHPFTVNKNLSFVHNGIIDGLGSKLHSDTFELNQILKDVIKGNEISEGIKRLLTLICADYSKLLFLDSENKVTIINEELGHWDNSGNWYSNFSYKPYEPKKYKWQSTFDKQNKKSTLNKLQEFCPCCYVQSDFDTFQYNKDFNEWICADCIEEIRISEYDL